MNTRLLIFILVIGLSMSASSAQAQVPDLIIYPIVRRFDHPVPCGADVDGDGRPEIYRGTILDWTITLRVTAP